MLARRKRIPGWDWRTFVGKEQEARGTPSKRIPGSSPPGLQQKAPAKRNACCTQVAPHRQFARVPEHTGPSALLAECLPPQPRTRSLHSFSRLTNVKVLERTLGLGTPVAVGGDLEGTEGVLLLTVLLLGHDGRSSKGAGGREDALEGNVRKKRQVRGQRASRAETLGMGACLLWCLGSGE